MESVRRLPAAVKVAVLAGAALALVVVGRSTDTGMPPIKHAAITGVGGTFFPTAPSRILDTRSNLGGSRLTAGGTLKLQVTTLTGAVPQGAGSVILNITVVTPDGDGYLTVWPDGIARPTASNLNFTSGEVIPNLVVVSLPASGIIDIYSPVGTDVIADVAGYFSPASTTTSGPS